ncbi:MAG: hypothetical protein A2W52_03700 [Candidatus Taylorbacteria bacterium RIFCSPHIGHO2_02_49_25]|uniref:Uncharacterized protein n=1 Tax=Candidatus Taylorbacteria bacterium RIFCSPHIGHO2_02_49_25 TaxID=1802305 RepID=A0A1G2MF48_9BACT|nr:MAG: hypothetical protein UY62_C0059G0007 [Parcubacteria group bacterium GW2011_GWF2_50_9]OHA21308.1 MAG: hypothetical protein A2759_00915 [Candidatus Taylorbacteria bacterium RIFCSPHIGHO2_01_FULL_49_60]OHA22526.1 MAG: hypothetical protein A2W52_03700 [Candidatus Taylorbacteria bacterium RIFCSPHIGHO2_02_49_25]OHA36721.1 MAG: hypothetical protein A2W65_01820 [Candidatus Taylorbacteria bacterium RIFCSPLOWO2_02_50_13]OHA48262.1 MAG: hypothetical protein A3G61_00610 [Candidatus Taylorbacteria ba
MAISACLLIWFVFENSAPGIHANQSFFILVIINIPSTFVLGFLPLKGNMQLAEVVILGAIQWFIIGALLGLLSGKIKNRKKVIQLNEP